MDQASRYLKVPLQETTPPFLFAIHSLKTSLQAPASHSIQSHPISAIHPPFTIPPPLSKSVFAITECAFFRAATQISWREKKDEQEARPDPNVVHPPHRAIRLPPGPGISCFQCRPVFLVQRLHPTQAREPCLVPELGLPANHLRKQPASKRQPSTTVSIRRAERMRLPDC